MEAKLNIRKNAKCYYVRLIWQEASGKRRKTEVSTGIPIEGGNKRKAKQRMEELKEEYRQEYEVCNLTYTKDVLFADLENHRRNIRNSTYQENDFVCKWQDGKPISCDYASRNFKTMLEKNGLPQIKFHSLRHSFATVLANSNSISLTTLQVMLGHSTLDMTRKYIHTDMKEKIKAGMVINEMLKQNLW